MFEWFFFTYRFWAPWSPHDSQTRTGVPPSSDCSIKESLVIYYYNPSHCSQLKDLVFVVKKNSATCLSHELGNHSCKTDSNLETTARPPGELSEER